MSGNKGIEIDIGCNGGAEPAVVVTALCRRVLASLPHTTTERRSYNTPPSPNSE